MTPWRCGSRTALSRVSPTNWAASVNVIKLATELLSAQPEDAAVNQRLLDKLLRNVDMLDQLALELQDNRAVERRRAGCGARNTAVY